MSFVYFDGRYLPRSQAFVPIDDRGFLFGDGVFTTIKLNAGSLECFEAHIARLNDNAKQLNIQMPQIELAWLKELVRLNDAMTGIWRVKIIVTGGKTELRRMSPRPHGHL